MKVFLNGEWVDTENCNTAIAALKAAKLRREEQEQLERQQSLDTGKPQVQHVGHES